MKPNWNYVIFVTLLVFAGIGFLLFSPSSELLDDDLIAEQLLIDNTNLLAPGSINIDKVITESSESSQVRSVGLRGNRSLLQHVNIDGSGNDLEKSAEKGEKDYTVTVLFWTKYYLRDILPHMIPHTAPRTYVTELNCPLTTCRLTTYQSELNDADAVIFNSRDVFRRHSFPPYRFEDQPWVYMQRESPIYTNLTLKDYPNVFNWTMTYRKDSDIHFPYGAVKFFPSANVAQFDYKLENSLFMKKADEVEAAWTVSHCSTQSKREELVKKLKKYISIDVYGVCGKNKCKKKNEEDGCHEELETKYKFYLSFENSMCEEYVTEKFFNVLNRSMIPVVYGYEDYSSIAPPGSFIDARSFKSVEELGKYLKFLSGNVTEYLKYFEWKKHYQVILGPTNEMWCGLCHKILENRVNGWKKKQWYANIHDWWNQSSSLLNSLDQDIIVRPSSKFSSNDSLLSFDFLTSNFNHRETVEDYPRSACVPPSTF